MKLVVFSHIPKTAGSSLGHYFLYRANVKTFWAGVTANGKCEEIMSLAFREERPTLIGGHFTLRIIKEAAQNRDIPVVTMFRDPVERLISHYKYAFTLPDHPHFPFITGNLEEDLKGMYGQIALQESQVNWLSCIDKSSSNNSKIDSIIANIINEQLHVYPVSEVNLAVKKISDLLHLNTDPSQMTSESMPYENKSPNPNGVIITPRATDLANQLLEDDYKFIATLLRGKN